jgi:hypothetical protein
MFYAKSVGTRFNATVWLYNVSNLWAYQVKLDVNDTLLNITKAWLPIWDSNWIFTGQSTVQPPVAFYDEDGDGVMESVLVGDSLLTGDPFTGDGILAIIELEIIYTPSTGTVSSTLNIDNTDTFLLDDKVSVIPSEKENGEYLYISLGTSIIDINVDQQYVIVNSTINISGEIKPPVEEANVTIEYKPEGGSWKVLTTNHTTNAAGWYTYEWIPTEPGALELRSSWPGNGTLTAAVSDPIQVYVKYESSITLNLSEENITTFNFIILNGSISPSRPSVNVTIEIKMPDGTWATIATVTTDENSTYHYEWKAHKFTDKTNETITFRSSWAGDNITYGSKSPSMDVTVWKTATTITMNVTPQTISKGGEVSIQGKITAPEPENLTIVLYVLDYQKGLDWEEKMGWSDTADANGSYSITYTFAENGTYGIKTGFKGNNDLLETYSTALNVTVLPPSIQSNITINVFPQETQIGSIVIINGTITPEAPDNQRVTIYYRIKGTTDPKELGVTYIYNNSYTLEWNASIGGELELQAAWEGYGDIIPSSSDWVPITIHKLESSITLEITPITIKIGEKITISGGLQPPINTTVALYYKNITQESWIFLRNVKVINGVYNYNWTIKQAGTFQLKAKWTGNLAYNPSESTVQMITINKLESNITIQVIPQKVTIGQNITISGQLTPHKNGTLIIIRYRKTTETSWRILAEVTTNAEGIFNYTWKTDEAGKFILEASWAGDETYQGTSATATVKIEEPLIQVILPYLMGGGMALAVIIFIIYLKKRKG